jgi:hypothetical protein
MCGECSAAHIGCFGSCLLLVRAPSWPVLDLKRGRRSGTRQPAGLQHRGGHRRRPRAHGFPICCANAIGIEKNAVHAMDWLLECELRAFGCVQQRASRCGQTSAVITRRTIASTAALDVVTTRSRLSDNYSRVLFRRRNEVGPGLICVRLRWRESRPNKHM